MNLISPITPIGSGSVLGSDSSWFDQNTINAAAMLLLKSGFVIVFGILLIFSMLVVRQISLMNSTVSTPMERNIKWVGYAYFAACLVAFLAAFVIL